MKPRHFLPKRRVRILRSANTRIGPVRPGERELPGDVVWQLGNMRPPGCVILDEPVPEEPHVTTVVDEASSESDLPPEMAAFAEEQKPKRKSKGRRQHRMMDAAEHGDVPT